MTDRPKNQDTGSRRYHKKSRNGCKQCKKIRKKCDEIPPRCGHCTRRNIPCEYESMSIAGSSSRSIASSSTPSSTPPSLSPIMVYSNPPHSQSGNIGGPSTVLSQPAQEAELMQFYHDFTYMTFSMLDFHQICEEVWRQTIPFQSQHFGFLKHAILAITTLHRARSFPMEAVNHASVARLHHERAMQAMSASFATIQLTAENATAVICYAFFQVLYRLGSTFIPGVPDRQDPLQCFNEFMVVLGLLWRLLPEAAPLIEGQPVATLVSRQNLVADYPLNPNHPEIFAALEDANQISADSEEDKAAYTASSLELQRLYSISSIPVTWPLILSWPVRSPSQIATFLNQRRPLALVHLAYWCVPIFNASLSGQQWFLDEWGRRTIIQIARMISPDYRPLLDWPLSAVGLATIPPRSESASASDISSSRSPPVVERRASDR